MDIHINTLEIMGAEQKGVPNTFFSQKEGSDWLTIFFPGRGYNCSMPILYYMRKLFLRAGADVLNVEYQYPSSPTLTIADLETLLCPDALASFQVALQQRNYKRLTLVGKSLGTKALSTLFAPVQLLQGIQTEVIWLTPLVNDLACFGAMKSWKKKSLYIIGTADPHFHKNRLEELKCYAHNQVLIFENLDHSLEYPDDDRRSILLLSEMMASIQKYITS